MARGVNWPHCDGSPCICGQEETPPFLAGTYVLEPGIPRPVPEPRISITRGQLVNAIAECSVLVVVVDGKGTIGAESMADAIIDAFRGGARVEHG